MIFKKECKHILTSKDYFNFYNLSHVCRFFLQSFSSSSSFLFTGIIGVSIFLAVLHLSPSSFSLSLSFCRSPVPRPPVSLSITFYSLFPVSLFFYYFAQPAFSRLVPPFKLSWILLKGCSLLKGIFFSCYCADLGVQALGFCLCNAPRDNFIV